MISKQENSYLEVEKWILEQIEDTLRMCWNNIDHNTCLGRNINQSRVLVDKLLKGEQITGHERFEKFEF